MPRRPRLRALACGLIALSLLLSACGGSSRGTGQTTSHQTITTTFPGSTATRQVGPESIFEAGLQLLNDPAGTLDTLRQLGVDRIKIFIPWSHLAPTQPKSGGGDPSEYPESSWAPFDAMIRDATARGIGVDVTINSAPPWALGPGAPKGALPGSWRPSDTAFGAFVHAVGTRYSGTYTPPGSTAPLPRVSMWSIWNEPNYGSGLSPTTTGGSAIEVSPMLYRGLLNSAWSALHATGHGHDAVLIGEVGPHGITSPGPGTFGPMYPLRFVRALYCVDQNLQPLRGTAATQRGCPATAQAAAGFKTANPALFQAAGFSDHPYPAAKIAPNVPTPAEPDDASLSSIGNLEKTLDGALGAYGSHRKLPIYSTEYGYQTDPPRATGNSVPPQTAADYLNQAEYMSWHDPRIASYDQFLLQDPPNGGTVGGFPSGLEFTGGQPKPAFAAYRMPIFLPVTSATKNEPLEVWGAVRPAHYVELDTGKRQHVEVQFANNGGAAFTTVATVPIADRHGYFDIRHAFAGSGTVRLAWAYPHGPTIFSRTVAIQVH